MFIHTIQAMDFGKNPYAKPQMEVYEVSLVNIIAASSEGNQPGSYIGEEWSDN